jgi:hypothetical protein
MSMINFCVIISLFNASLAFTSLDDPTNSASMGSHACAVVMIVSLFFLFFLLFLVIMVMILLGIFNPQPFIGYLLMEDSP